MGLSFAQRFVHLNSETSLNVEFIQALQRNPAMMFNYLLAKEFFLVSNCQGDSWIRISLHLGHQGQDFPAAGAPGPFWGPSGEHLAASTWSTRQVGTRGSIDFIESLGSCAYYSLKN